MASVFRRPSLSAENCFLDDNKKEEAKEENVIAPKFSGTARHMQGDTGAPAVPSGASAPSISASKRCLQRPSQPPPPPPCQSGDNVEEDIVAGEAGQLTMLSVAHLTELHHQLQQQQQQQPRCKYRPGQRSPIRPMTKSQQPLQPKDYDKKDKKCEDGKATDADAVAPTTAADAVKSVVSVSEILIDSILRDAEDACLDHAAADASLQRLPEIEDASETSNENALPSAAVAHSSLKHTDNCTHSTDIQGEVLKAMSTNDEVDECSSSVQWMKRPCGVIEEEVSLDELMEKMEKLEQELRRQLNLKKQKMIDNARQKERIAVLEKINSELRMRLTETENEVIKKDIKLAIAEETNENLSMSLKSTKDVLAKLENDYDRAVEEKLEFKSLYIDSRLKASEGIGDMTEEINRQIEAKRSFVRLAQQFIPWRSGDGLKKALATTADYLRIKCERNQLQDKVQYLRTRVEVQDLYIDDLSSAVKELSRILQHYKVSLPGMEEKEEVDEEEEAKENADDDQSSTGQCATLTDESSGEASPSFESTMESSSEDEAEETEEDQRNQEDDREEELEDICDETSDSDSRTETTEEIILEFHTPLSSPTSSIRQEPNFETDTN